MRLIILILWFLLVVKTFFFWIWLWQLKEYHPRRLRAHFETQKFKKIISGFWRVKIPKFTKKIILVLLSGVILEGVILFYIFSLPNFIFYLLLLFLLLITPIISSLIVLLFQIPTYFLIKRILKKAKLKIKRFENLLVIGITGSYGKTSTKEFLYAILYEKFGDKVLKTKEHVNAEIGIAQSILKELKKEHEIFVAEIGAYERGKIKDVCQMLEPRIGILTGISEQHLSTFGSQENIIKAKFELIESLPEDGLAIFNGDNKIIQNQSRQSGTKIKVKNQKLCSTKEKLDLWTEDIIVEKEHLSFRIFSKDGDSADFSVNLIGAQNVEDILLASCCAKELGMNFKEISMACQKLKPLKGAMRLLKREDGLNILDASYSANPQGVISHLEHLKLWEGKKIIVMPCLIELGAVAKEIHQKIGEKIGEICGLAIITTEDYFKDLREGAEKTGMKKENIVFLKGADEIFEKIKNFCNQGDVILLESRVPQKLVKMLIEENGN